MKTSAFLPSFAVLAVSALALAASAQAQPRPETVTWTVAAASDGPVKPGGRVALSLSGTVRQGWHVYGLKQLPDGPTPLRVTIEPSEVAVGGGAPTGSKPTVAHDPSFNLQTQYYDRPFTVTAPVRISSKAASGRQVIPVSVHYQTCDGQFCQPPKTVRLSASVNVQG